MEETTENYRDWYTLQVYNSRESKVQETINLKRENGELGSVLDMYVPTEEVISISPKGKKSTLNKSVYPGYVFIKMEHNAIDVVEILSLPFTQRFIGDKSKPVVMSESEARKILEHKNKEKKAKYRISFEKGDTVLIKEGAFADYKGEVGDINHEQNEVTVIVKVLGRETNVKVSLHDVEQGE